MRLSCGLRDANIRAGEYSGQGQRHYGRYGDSGDSGLEDDLEGTYEGELRYGSHHVRLRGRALRLILWLAGHQRRINETAPESGQIWLTWKGEGPRSIDGDIRTRL